MNQNDTMSKLLNLVCNKLDQVASANDLNATLVKDLDVLIDIKKDILEIQAMEAYSKNENGYENGYSQASHPMHMGMYGNSYGKGYMIHPYYYNQEYGYPEGNQKYYTELMNGAYSRDNNNGNYNGGGNSYNNSYNNGYSRDSAENEMMDMLRNMANNASSNEKREMYHRFMNEMERAK